MGLHKIYIPIIIAVCFCGIIFFSLNDYGVTWDERAYADAGSSSFPPFPPRWGRNFEKRKAHAEGILSDS